MAVDLDSAPYVQASFFGPAIREVSVITIHTAETPETPFGAEGVANYFASGNVRASTHFTVDVDSIVRCVPEDQRCWGAGEGPANDVSLQWELAGYAGQDGADWKDDYSRWELVNLAAGCQTLLGRYPHIRPVRLTGAQLRAGERDGFAGHADWHEGWPVGAYRSDPGPEFPWDDFLAMVAQREPSVDQIGAFFEMVEGIDMAKGWLVNEYGTGVIRYQSGACVSAPLHEGMVQTLINEGKVLPVPPGVDKATWPYWWAGFVAVRNKDYLDVFVSPEQ